MYCKLKCICFINARILVVVVLFIIIQKHIIIINTIIHKMLLGKSLTAQNHIMQFIKHMPVIELINHEMNVCIACTVHVQVCVFHYTALDEQVYLYLMSLIFLFDLMNIPACILSYIIINNYIININQTVLHCQSKQINIQYVSVVDCITIKPNSVGVV